jgi:arogenate dehydrogenase (NADP+)
MELADTSISTKGFESLRSLVDNTYNDSFDLYYGLFMYNKNATIELSRLEQAFDEVKGQLFNRLHEIIRNEIFTEVDATQDMENSSLSNLQGASEDDKKKK